jgi:uncharacterized protein DUF4129
MVGWERRPLSEAVLERFRQRQRLPAWLAALLSLPIMLPLAALAYLVWARSTSGQDEDGAAGFAVIARFFDLLARARKPDTSVPLFDLAVAALAFAVALAVFAVAVLVALPARLARLDDEEGSRPLPEPPAETRDDLRAEPNARRAIIEAYRRFEQALAGVKAPRAPWQTPAEFMRVSLALPAVPRADVERLTALFEVARFSDRHLGADARDAACDCLDVIEAALERDAASGRAPDHGRPPTTHAG